MKDISEVIDGVEQEVRRARNIWGREFDEQNTLNDWAAHTNHYLAKALAIGTPREAVIDGLRKAAGLVVSALWHAENDCLARRHYDSMHVGQADVVSLPTTPGHFYVPGTTIEIIHSFDFHEMVESKKFTVRQIMSLDFDSDIYALTDAQGQTKRYKVSASVPQRTKNIR